MPENKDPAIAFGGKTISPPTITTSGVEDPAARFGGRTITPASESNTFTPVQAPQEKSLLENALQTTSDVIDTVNPVYWLSKGVNSIYDHFDKPEEKKNAIQPKPVKQDGNLNNMVDIFKGLPTTSRSNTESSDPNERQYDQPDLFDLNADKGHTLFENGPTYGVVPKNKNSPLSIFTPKTVLNPKIALDKVAEANVESTYDFTRGASDREVIEEQEKLKNRLRALEEKNPDGTPKLSAIESSQLKSDITQGIDKKRAILTDKINKLSDDETFLNAALRLPLKAITLSLFDYLDYKSDNPEIPVLQKQLDELNQVKQSIIAHNFAKHLTETSPVVQASDNNPGSVKDIDSELRLEHYRQLGSDAKNFDNTPALIESQKNKYTVDGKLISDILHERANIIFNPETSKPLQIRPEVLQSNVGIQEDARMGLNIAKTHIAANLAQQKEEVTKYYGEKDAKKDPKNPTIYDEKMDAYKASINFQKIEAQYAPSTDPKIRAIYDDAFKKVKDYSEQLVKEGQPLVDKYNGILDDFNTINKDSDAGFHSLDQYHYDKEKLEETARNGFSWSADVKTPIMHSFTGAAKNAFYYLPEEVVPYVKNKLGIYTNEQTRLIENNIAQEKEFDYTFMQPDYLDKLKIVDMDQIIKKINTGETDLDELGHHKNMFNYRTLVYTMCKESSGAAALMATGPFAPGALAGEFAAKALVEKEAGNLVKSWLLENAAWKATHAAVMAAGIYPEVLPDQLEEALKQSNKGQLDFDSILAKGFLGATKTTLVEAAGLSFLSPKLTGLGKAGLTKEIIGSMTDAEIYSYRKEALKDAVKMAFGNAAGTALKNPMEEILGFGIDKYYASKNIDYEYKTPTIASLSEGFLNTAIGMFPYALHSAGLHRASTWNPDANLTQAAYYQAALHPEQYLNHALDYINGLDDVIKYFPKANTKEGLKNDIRAVYQKISEDYKQALPVLSELDNENTKSNYFGALTTLKRQEEAVASGTVLNEEDLQKQKDSQEYVDKVEKYAEMQRILKAQDPLGYQAKRFLPYLSNISAQVRNFDPLDKDSPNFTDTLESMQSIQRVLQINLKKYFYQNGYKNLAGTIQDQLNTLNTKLNKVGETSDSLEAQTNNDKNALTIEKANGKSQEIQFNKPYYAAKEEFNENGTQVANKQEIKVIKDNGDGTVQVVTNNDTITDVPKQELAKWSLFDKDEMDKGIKIGDPKAFVFDHINHVFSYEFGKETDTRVKAPKGRLVYHDNNIDFVYKGKDGSRQVYTLQKSDLDAFKKGKGKLKFERTLETDKQYEVESKKVQESATKTNFDALNSQASRRWEFIKKYISTKKEEIEKQKELISKAEYNLLQTEKEIEKIEADFKKATPKTRGKANFTKILSTLNNLKNSHTDLTQHIDLLKTQKEDLEKEIEYLKGYESKEFDSQQSLIDSLVNDQFSLELELERVNTNISGIEKVVQSITDSINKFLKIIDNLNKGFVKAYGEEKVTNFDADQIRDLLEVGKETNKLYPNTPDFLERNPEYLKNIRKLQELYDKYVNEIIPLDDQIEGLLQEIRNAITESKDIQDKIRYQQSLIEATQKAQDQFKEEKVIKKVQGIAAQIYKNEADAQTSTDTKSPEEDANNTPKESKKIPIEVLFNSTTNGSNFKDETGFKNKAVVRFQKFLNTVQDIAKNYELRIVTKYNAGGLGLSHILFTETDDATDNERGKDIVLVLVNKAGNFVDENGVETKDLNNLVYTSMREANLNWSTGEKAYSVKDDADDILAEELQKTYSEFRQSILDTTKANANSSVTLGISGISRGMKTSEETEQNPVVGTVLPKNVDLVNTKVVFIPTNIDPTQKTGAVSYQGNKNIKMPIGRPILSFLQHFGFLTNKKFTKEDSDKFINLFKFLYEDYRDNKGANAPTILKYLQKTLYVRNPNKPSKITGKKQDPDSIGNNQIWFSNKDGFITLNLGKDFSIPFNFEETNTDNFLALEAYFTGKGGSGIYHNVDDQKLIGEEFTEILGIKDGKLATQVWSSYQQYLLSDKNPDGTKRNILEIPLTINQNPSTDVPNNYGRYIVYENGSNQTVLDNNKKTVVNNKKDTTEVTTTPTTTDSTNYENITDNSLVGLKPGEYKWENKGNTINFVINPNKTITVINHTIQGFSNESVVNSLESFYKGKESPVNMILSKKVTKSIPKVEIPTGVVKSRFAKETPAVEEEIKEEKTTVTPTDPTDTETAKSSGLSLLDSIVSTPTSIEEDSDDSAYRIANTRSYKLENLEEAKKWLQERLPQFSFNTVYGLVAGKAWGRLKGSAITLSDIAAEGTVYHEAFEAVYKFFTNNAQKRTLRRQFKERVGSFIDSETGNSVKYSEATDHQIKEQLAEEYREYETSNGSLTWKGENVKKSLFGRIRSFIHDFVFKTDGIEEVFKKISDGAYKDKTINFDTQDIDSNYRLADIKKTNPTFVNDLMKSMTNILFAELNNQNRSISEIFSDDYNIENEHSRVKKGISNYYGGADGLNIISAYNKESFVRDFSKKENFVKLFSVLTRTNSILFVPKGTEQESRFRRYVKENSLSELQMLEKLYDLLENYKYINDNWKDITDEHRDYLAKYNLEFKNSAEDETEIVNSDENKTQNDYAIKVNMKFNAATEVKLLIATLTDQVPVLSKASKMGIIVKNTVTSSEPKLNSLVMSQLVDYNNTINTLLKDLSSAVNFEDMATILKEKAIYNPSLNAIVKKLKLEGGELSEYDVDLRNKFYASLNSMSVNYQKLILNPTDLTGATIELNDENAANILKKKWLSATRSNDKAFTLVRGVLTFNKEASPVKSIKDVNDAISLLNFLGYEYKINLSEVETEDKESILKASTKLFELISASQNAETIMYDTSQVSKVLSNLAKVYIKYNDSFAEPQHLNIEKEPVQNQLLHNFVGIVLKSINISKTFDEFITRIPQLNPESEGNAWLSFSNILSPNSKIYRDGKLTKRLNLQILEGSETRESSGGTPTSKLFLIDRIAQEFSFNLQGIYAVLTPADTKTEWGINFGKFFTKEQSTNDKYITDEFKKYLKAEIAAVQQGNTSNLKIFEKNKDSLRFFKDIIDFDLKLDKGTPDEIVQKNETKIDKAILKYVNDNTQKTLKFFKENRIIADYSPKEEGNFISAEALLADNTNKFTILFAPKEFTKEGLSEKEVEALIKLNELNYAFNIFEQYKLFWGDPAQWKDPTKRIKSFVSTRMLSVNDAAYFNEFNNKKLNTLSYIDSEGNPQSIDLQPGDFGYIHYDDELRTSTYKDVIVHDINLPGYNDINEADAQGIAFPNGYREIKQRFNSWSKEDEAQKQWDDSLCRWENLYGKDYETGEKLNHHENLYPEGDRGEKLKAYDESILSQGNPYLNASEEGKKTAIYNVLKPIYAGFKNGDVAAINLDKLSVAPYTWRLVRNSNAAQFYLEHYKASTHYVKFESVTKIGEELGTQELYDATGKPNLDIKQQKLNFKYFGNQVETIVQKAKVTLGTQLTKLITLNLSPSTHAKYIANNSNYLKALKEMAKKEIFDEFGINTHVDENGTKHFIFESDLGLEKMFQRELNNRQAPDNLKDIMKTVDGKFKLPFDLVIGSERLESIITSIIDNNILRPKMKGGSMPQIASTLLEKNPRIFEKDINGKKRLVSNDLKFYENEDGKRYCEVYLPFSMQEFIKKGKELSINDIPESLKYGIGFRIPSQALNSFEHFKIKGFLPVEYGNAIVVPSAITTKAGSDFDIDKLNIYLYHYTVNKKTNLPEKTEYMDEKTKPIDRYRAYVKSKTFSALSAIEDNESFQQVRDSYFEPIRDQINKILDKKVKETPESKEATKAFEDFKAKVSEITSANIRHDISSIIRYSDGISVYERHEALDQYVKNAQEDSTISQEQKNKLNDALLEYGNYISLMNEVSKVRDMFKTMMKGTIGYEKFKNDFSEATKDAFADFIIDNEIGSPSFEDFQKLPIEMQNSKEAVENAYIDNIRNILTLPENFAQLTEPNSAKDLQDQSKQIKELYKEDTSEKSPTYYLSRLNNAQDRYSFLAGKGAVGIVASNQVQNAIGQIVGLSFTKSLGSPKFNFDFPTNSTTSKDKRTFSLSSINNTEGKQISSIISSFIDSLVDIAKDPYIFSLNGNLETISIYITGIRLGIPLEYMTRWFNQPIIREYVKRLQQNKSVSTELQDLKRLKGDIIDSLAKEYGFSSVKGAIEPIERSENFNIKELESYITNYVDNNNIPDINKTNQKFIDAQANLLKQFLDLTDLSWELFHFGQAINLDTSRTQSLESIRIKMAKVQKGLNGLFGDYVRKTMNNTFIGTIYNAKLELLNALKPLQLTESDAAREVLNPILNEIYQSIGSSQDIEDEARKMRKHFVTYLIHTIEFKFGNDTEKSLLTSKIDSLLKGENSAAISLKKIKIGQQKKDIAENFFTKNLFSVIPSLLGINKQVSTITPIKKMTDKLDSDLNTSDFRNLLNSPSTEQYFYDFVETALLQSGLNSNPNSFSDQIPNEVFEDIAKQVKSYFENRDISEILSGFKTSYYKNQWYNKDLVPEARKLTSNGNSRLVDWNIPTNTGRAKPFLEFFIQGNIGKFIPREAYKPFLMVTTEKKDVDGSPLYSNYEKEQMKKKGDFSFLDRTLYQRFEIFNTETGEMDSPMIERQGKDGVSHIMLFYPTSKFGDKNTVVEHYSKRSRSKINDNKGVITDAQGIYDMLLARGTFKTNQYSRAKEKSYQSIDKVSDVFFRQHIVPSVSQDSEDFIDTLTKNLSEDEYFNVEEYHPEVAETPQDIAPKVDPINIGNTKVFEHSEDTASANGEINSISDTKLTPEGREEASKLGQYLKSLGFTEVITSTVARAVETAEIITKEQGIPHKTLDLLKTWNQGDFKGQPEESFDENHWVENETLSPEGGESFKTFRERVQNEVLPMIQDLPEKTAVIAHSKVMRLLDVLNNTGGIWNNATKALYLKNEDNLTKIEDESDPFKNECK